MCGIVAMFAPQASVSQDALTRATAQLTHRGPDCQRTWIDRDGRVGLGHARLSIIDLATGDQPIASEDERLQIVVNGEFYDFPRIQRDLEARGHRLRTRSDSEVALHLYEESGPACLAQLRGEFAFVLWDGRNNRLFAARDRFGIKPLYYAQQGDVLYLASEVKALFAAGIPARWDRSEFFRAIHCFGSPPRPGTSFFAGVRQVPPGHFLIAQDGQVRLERYWDFDYPSAAEAPPSATDADYAEQFRAVFDEAVRIRLRADVPIGCYLSGGIDSCAVLGTAAAHTSEPIHAFTLSFDRQEYDETAIARAMASHALADFRPVPITQTDLADHFAAAVTHAEVLAFNGHGVAKYLLSRAVRAAGFKVVLTGEGSDEILAGYAHFRRDILLQDDGSTSGADVERRLGELGASNPLARGLLLPDGQAIALDGVQGLLGFIPSWLEVAATLAHKVRALFSASFLDEVHGLDPYVELIDALDVLGQLKGRAPLNQSLYLWSKVVLPNYILAFLGDRMEMAHSIEGRVPFLDHHVVELARSLPVSQKIRGPVEKYVLREATRPILTNEVYERHKHPFVSPPAALAGEGRFYDLLQDTLRGPALESLPFFDRARVISLLDQIPTMTEPARIAHDPALMIVLSACLLQQHFGLDAGYA